MIVWRVVRESFFRQVAKRWRWIQENTSVSLGSTPCLSWGETRGDVTPCQLMAMAGSSRRIQRMLFSSYGLVVNATVSAKSLNVSIPQANPSGIRNR